MTLTGGNIAPRLSRDGTRLAFLRPDGVGQLLAITNADGSGLVESKGEPLVDPDTDSIAWSPNGRWVAVVADAGPPRTPGAFRPRTTYLVDTTTGKVRDLDTPGVDTEVYWRPPDGRQLMYVTARSGWTTGLSSSSTSRIRASIRYPLRNPSQSAPRRLDAERGALCCPPSGLAKSSPGRSFLDPETGADERLPMSRSAACRTTGPRSSGIAISLEIRVLCVMPLPGGDCVPIADR